MHVAEKNPFPAIRFLMLLAVQLFLFVQSLSEENYYV